MLGRLKSRNKAVFFLAMKDSSYLVAGNALTALGLVDSTAAYNAAKEFSAQKTKGALSQAVTNVIYTNAGESDFETLAGGFEKLPLGNEKFSLIQPFSNYLKRLKNSDNFRKGIDIIVSFRESLPEDIRGQLNSYINGVILNGIAGSRQSMGLTEDAEYVKSKLEVKANSPNAISVPAELLLKYAGEYDFDGGSLKVIVKDNKTLFLALPGQSDLELTPVSKTLFTLKFMDDNKIEFVTNDKGEVTELILKSETDEIKAPRKK